MQMMNHTSNMIYMVEAFLELRDLFTNKCKLAITSNNHGNRPIGPLHISVKISDFFDKIKTQSEVSHEHSRKDDEFC